MQRDLHIAFYLICIVLGFVTTLMSDIESDCSRVNRDMLTDARLSKPTGHQHLRT